MKMVLPPAPNNRDIYVHKVVKSAHIRNMI